MTTFEEKGKEMDRPRRILIVDDEEVYRETVGNWLELHGYEVSKAKDGEDALKVLQNFVPDLVITDFLMPRMGGIALLKALRESHKELPVVMVTGYPEVEGQMAEIQDHITVPLSKSMALDTLKEQVERLTRRF